MSIDIESVCVVYERLNAGPIEAVASVDLTIKDGESLVIIGPSGCGKSTLLECMGGLLKPTSGVVRIDGAEVRKPDPRRGAFVFQDYALFPWMRVIDNVAVGLRFEGISRKERREIGLRYLKMVGLADFVAAHPGELSGGMRQRVAVARALAMQPKVLLLDEPFAAIDEQSRRRMGVEMSKLLTITGQTTVMVTHSLDEAIFWADRVVVMSRRPGRLIGELIVSAPRPRSLEFLVSDEVVELRRRLFERLGEAEKMQNSSLAWEV